MTAEVDARSRRQLLKLGLVTGGALGMAHAASRIAAAREQAPEEAGRVRAIVNARELGAIGDGRVDDAPAIQRAIDRALDLGTRAVYLPTGIYAISQSLVLSAPNLVLTGDAGSTVLRGVASPRLHDIHIRQRLSRDSA